MRLLRWTAASACQVGGRSRGRVCGSRVARAASGTLVAAYAAAQGTVLRMGADERRVPASTLAWQVLPMDADIELEGADALWMEIKP